MPVRLHSGVACEQDLQDGELAAKLVRNTPKSVQRLLWLDKDDIASYSPIPWANARLKLLAEHAFAEGAQASPSRFHPERLLWIPPTCSMTSPSVHSSGMSQDTLRRSSEG